MKVFLVMILGMLIVGCNDPTASGYRGHYHVVCYENGQQVIAVDTEGLRSSSAEWSFQADGVRYKTTLRCVATQPDSPQSQAR